MTDKYSLTDDYEEIVFADTVLSYVNTGVSGKQFHDLKNGYIHWEAKLDIQGFQTEAAREVLSEFIDQQVKNKKKCLLIVHGTDSARNNPPLLKNLLNHWLPQIKEVSAFHSAQYKDGGVKAIYVLLKKEKIEAPVIERGSSFLVADTKDMERRRRLAEQQGERQIAPVKARDHSALEPAPSPEGELQNNILQHPELDSQRYDGIDPNLNPEPALNTEARREFDNEKREQEKEKQLRLGNMPKFSSAPTPRGP